MQFTDEPRDNLPHGFGRACRGRDHILRGGARAVKVFVAIVQDTLILGIAVHGGHKPAFDADTVHQDLSQGGEAIGGAGRARDNLIGRFKLVMIDAVHHCAIYIFTGGRNQHFFCARIKVALYGIAASEDTRAFHHNINA